MLVLETVDQIFFYWMSKSHTTIQNKFFTNNFSETFLTVILTFVWALIIRQHNQRRPHLYNAFDTLMQVSILDVISPKINIFFWKEKTSLFNTLYHRPITFSIKKLKMTFLICCKQIRLALDFRIHRKKLLTLIYSISKF